MLNSSFGFLIKYSNGFMSKRLMIEKKLFDICRPKQWKTISSASLKEVGYPVYGANGIIGFNDNYNHEKPTILITCRGATCGTINVSQPFSYINGNAMALDDLDETTANINYLAYYLTEVTHR